jgi:phage protein U
MYAQLGNIVFQGLKGFTSFQSKRETNLVQHAVIEGKPRLQRIGTNLEEVTITIQFHASFCVPETEMTALDSLREAAEIVPLLTGSGEFLGNFVIQAITKDVEELGTDGSLKSLTASLTLLEGASSDPLAAASLAAKLGGIGNAANLASKVTQVARIHSEAAAIAKPMSTARALAASAGTAIAKAKAVAAQGTHYVRRAQEGLKETRNALNEANKAVTDAKQVYQSAQRMKQAIADPQGAVSATLAALQGGTIDDALTANVELQKAVPRSNGAFSEVTNIAGTRR